MQHHFIWMENIKVKKRKKQIQFDSIMVCDSALYSQENLTLIQLFEITEVELIETCSKKNETIYKIVGLLQKQFGTKRTTE